MIIDFDSCQNSNINIFPFIKVFPRGFLGIFNISSRFGPFWFDCSFVLEFRGRSGALSVQGPRRIPSERAGRCSERRRVSLKFLCSLRFLYKWNMQSRWWRYVLFSLIVHPTIHNCIQVLISHGDARTIEFVEHICAMSDYDSSGRWIVLKSLHTTAERAIFILKPFRIRINSPPWSLNENLFSRFRVYLFGIRSLTSGPSSVRSARHGFPPFCVKAGGVCV